MKATSRFLLRTLVLIASGILPAESRADQPSDHIDYLRPYARAVRQAERAGRILIVRPFPVGGVIDGSRDGRWCPLADYMRAVTLSDETVVTLINRRFVFTYFSLVDWSELSDAEAKKAIVQAAPEFGAKVRPTPPTFFLSPNGEVLGTLETLASPATFLQLAKRLLAAHPEYDRPSSEETALAKRAAQDSQSRLRLARLQLELADVVQAKATLASLIATGGTIEDAVRAEALYLLGQRARAEGDAERAEAYFSRVELLPPDTRQHLALDLRVERAHLAALRGDWERSLQAWNAIEADAPSSARMGEILYAKGLSYYHLGQRRDANYTWIRIIKELPEGRYYQRARLAAMGPTYSPASPDLTLPGKTQIVRYVASPQDPRRLPGSDLGYGMSSDGRAGTDETPERFLRRAFRDYGEVQRRRGHREEGHGL